MLIVLNGLSNDARHVHVHVCACVWCPHAMRLTCYAPPHVTMWLSCFGVVLEIQEKPMEAPSKTPPSPSQAMRSTPSFLSLTLGLFTHSARDPNGGRDPPAYGFVGMFCYDVLGLHVRVFLWVMLRYWVLSNSASPRDCT